MLVVDDISISFGHEQVLSHFSCHVKKNDFACIVGNSGSGKTSLLKAFIGLTPLVSGTIRVGEYELNERTCNIIRKKTMYLPQELSFPSETVHDLILQTLRVDKAKNVQNAMSKLKHNLSLLGLDDDLLDKRVAEISGGQRQRVMLATLALLDKDVWLLDEPTAALDSTSRDLVITFLKHWQQMGKTIVAVSHDAHFTSHCSPLIQLH